MTKEQQLMIARVATTLCRACDLSSTEFYPELVAETATNKIALDWRGAFPREQVHTVAYVVACAYADGALDYGAAS
jgi:hypothetical protein